MAFLLLSAQRLCAEHGHRLDAALRLHSVITNEGMSPEHDNCYLMRQVSFMPAVDVYMMFKQHEQVAGDLLR